MLVDLEVFLESGMPNILVRARFVLFLLLLLLLLLFLLLLMLVDLRVF